MSAPAKIAATLTNAERKTLNAAMDIILAHTPQAASWLFLPQNYHGTPGCDVTYFDTGHRQHSGLWGPDCTFADKIEMGIRRQAELPTPEAVKQQRIEQLRDELAKLTGEAA